MGGRGNCVERERFGFPETWLGKLPSEGFGTRRRSPGDIQHVQLVTRWHSIVGAFLVVVVCGPFAVKLGRRCRVGSTGDGGASPNLVTA